VHVIHKKHSHLIDELFAAIAKQLQRLKNAKSE